MKKMLGLVGLVLLNLNTLCLSDTSMSARKANMYKQVVPRQNSYFSDIRVVSRDTISGVMDTEFEEYIDVDNDDSVEVVRHYKWKTSIDYDITKQNMIAFDRIVMMLTSSFPNSIYIAWTDHITSRLSASDRPIKKIEDNERVMIYPRSSAKAKTLQHIFDDLSTERDIEQIMLEIDGVNPMATKYDDEMIQK